VDRRVLFSRFISTGVASKRSLPSVRSHPHCLSMFASFRSLLARSRRLGAIVAFGLWTLAVGAGFCVLVEYEMTAGPSAIAPKQWPEGTGLRFDSQRANLVMFAHPQCPCSRASMDELAVIMTHCGQQMHATVCFLDLDDGAADWKHSDLWRMARAIPGVDVIADHNARLADRFASATSGQVFLFDREGHKIFSGGITGARGHEGDNRGRQAVIALARGELCTTSATPVFGCSLHDPPAREARR
jgi:hypothetical protein